MRKWLIPLLILVNTAAHGKADGFQSIKPEFVRDNIEVTFVSFRSKEELKRAAESMGVWIDQDRRLMAFSKVSLNGTKCTIYMVDAVQDYAPEYVGHELMHCRYGRWHK